MHTTYPIVLAAGIARFDIVTALLKKNLELFGLEISDAADYFKGIASELGPAFDVRGTHVPFADAVELRAARLKANIESIDRPKVHVIAHSMGGLDARHMIVNHQMENRVASVTTIGTPHWGSSVAEFLLDEFGAGLSVLDKLVSIDGLKDLTREKCREFNLNAEDSEARNPVRYQAYSSVEAPHLLFLPLRLGAQVIRQNEAEPNDGLVPKSSQLWQDQLISRDGTIVKDITQVEFPISADHLNEVGWWDLNQLSMADGFFLDMRGVAKRYEAQVRKVYRRIAEGLKDW